MRRFTKKSMMRLAMLWTLRLSIVLVLFIPIGMMLQIVLKESIDLIGWAAYLGAVGVFMAPVVIGKAVQKNSETKNEDNE